MAQPRAIGSRLTDVLAKVQRDLDGVRDEFLLNMANDIVDQSPVWTGQYVTSHSINTGSKAGQFTSNLESGWTERTTVPDAYKAEARANLRSDIAGLPPTATTIYINNNAPHAGIVEYGGWATRPPHRVYETVLNRAGIHLQDAINTVKARQ